MTSGAFFRVFWGLMVVGFIFTLSRYPARFKRETPLLREQTWGCRAVGLALAVVFGLNLLNPLARILLVGVPPWGWLLLLVFLPLLYVAPVGYLVCVRERRPLQTLGFAGARTISLIAAATAVYFFLFHECGTLPISASYFDADCDSHELVVLGNVP